MLAVLLPFLKKFGPYIGAALLSFVAGGYAGYSLEYGAVEAAKLALSAQQKSDASVAAAANAQAAAYLAESDSKDNLAEANLGVANTKVYSNGSGLTAFIDTQAPQPGQDAGDAPVLAAVLDDLAKGNP